MAQEVQLVWNAAEVEFARRQRVYFMYTAGHGLTDIDFHSVTAREWKHMKSPAADSVAYLQVAEQITVKQLDDVIRNIAQMGGYKTIVVSSRP